MGDGVRKSTGAVLMVEREEELIQGKVGKPGARASALKQWSQDHTLSIQCLDMRTDSRVIMPSGATVADHSV